MRHRNLLYLLATLIAVVGAGSAVAMAQVNEQDDPFVRSDGSVDLTQIKEPIVRELFDDQGFLVDHNARTAELAMNYDGGFGGFYFSEDKATAYVFMLDPNKVEAAESAFAAVYGGDRKPEIAVVQGDYSLDQLTTWYSEINKAFAAAGIHASSGIALQANRLSYSLVDLDEGKRAKIRGILAGISVPEEALILANTTDPLLLSKADLDDEWDPTVGGIRWEAIFPASIGGCTITFTTERDNVEGLVVASHCTSDAEHPDSLGGLDSTTVYQPDDDSGWPPWDDHNIAVETIDPTPVSSGCQSGYTCRYSDAAFADIHGDDDIDLGEIAKPKNDTGTIDVDPDGTTFDIVAETSSLSIDDEVWIVGQNGGWMKGDIKSLCYDVEWTSDDFELKCHYLILETVGTAVTGDSGAPVFIEGSTDDEVELIGLLSGRVTVNLGGGSQSYLYISQIGYIYYDLGVSSTWESCIPSKGC